MIRQAAVDDLKQIVEGYREHFAYERTHTAYTVFREGVYPTGEDAEKAIRSGAMYVYEENGIVQGSMILDGEQPEEYRKIAWTSRAQEEQVRVIHLLMVRPGQSGKGIGTALLKYAERLAGEHSCKVIRLDTGEQNIPAAALYQKNGYQIVAAASMRVGGMICHSRHLFLEKELAL